MSKIKVNSLEGVGASSPAITIDNTSGTCTANLTNRTNKNIIINGAMQVAQRGTSSTTNGYGSVDRFQCQHAGADENPTHTQHTLTSSDTGPYEQGFRKSFHVQNGNQTGGAGASDWMRIWHKFEAQDIANSGWNYTSASSYITLSFWVKVSVAQTYYVQMATQDGTSKMYYFAMNLSANTWTKVTHSISGHSDLTFDNNTDEGLYIAWYGFRGTNNTGSGEAANQWNNFNGSALTPDQTTTWWTTNDSTFEITGVQLEVGSVATDFEHLNFSDDLKRCQRYYYDHANGSRVAAEYIGVGYGWVSSQVEHIVRFPVPMRTGPSLVNSTGTNYYQFRNENQEIYLSDMDIDNATTHTALLYKASISGATEGRAYRFQLGNSSAYLHFNAEL